MSVPDLDGVLSGDEVVASAEHLARLQRPSGMIPWWPGGHCDPWNHVESAMALDVAGFHAEAEQAYEWLAAIQRPDGAWHNYYLPDGHRDDTVEEWKLDTNVCAYIATGVWHHWRCTGDRGFVDNLWPTVERALTFVLAQRRPDGLPRWAVEPCPDGGEGYVTPWDYALLTGTCSIQHALRCAASVGGDTGSPRPDWVEMPPDAYWRAAVDGTRAVFARSGAHPADLAAIGFGSRRKSRKASVAPKFSRPSASEGTGVPSTGATTRSTL